MSNDTIYREDAIKAVWGDDINPSEDGMVFEAQSHIDRDIKLIPSADRPQGDVDAIDRDALIDYCLKLIDVERKQGSDVMNYGQERVNQTEAIIDYIEHMPHVNTDRPQGEWIWSPRDIDGTVSGCCSKCSFTHLFVGGHTAQYNFCPNCGCRMKGSDDE